MSIKVAVVCGGSSVEHEVSVITAMQAAAALDRSKYTPIALYITKDNRFFTGDNLLDINSYKDIPTALKNAMEVIPVRHEGKSVLMSFPPKTFGKGTFIPVDVVLTAVHGTNVEDGTLQGLLEYWGVPYSGCNVCASAAGMDKWVMKSLFRAQGIPCLEGMLLSRNEFYSDIEKSLDMVEQKFGYPVIVKPSNLGSSVGISKARDRAALENSLSEALGFAQTAIVERAVQNLREINCAVLGDIDSARPSVCEEPLNATDILTYKDKYQSGGGTKGGKLGGKAGGDKLSGGAKGASGMASLSRQIPADIPADMEARVKELAVKAFQAIGASGVARVDFLLDGESGELFVNEINTVPGSLAYYLWEAGGMSFTQLVDELITLALKKQRDKEKLSFSFDTNLLATASLPTSGAKGGAKA
ncbi:MAG: D-alanine--D-alanine ligase [Clostridia bacterium]|nr:D-alanine--D-alanine ligase [Clostridia bacterium]MBQ5813150.1 D-alanine--D-alanine ligase [Clostridia bacterium]